MKNRISIFIPIIVTCAILFTSAVINGNITTAQQPNKNNSTGFTKAAANTTKEAKAAANKTCH